MAIHALRPLRVWLVKVMFRRIVILQFQGLELFTGELLMALHAYTISFLNQFLACVDCDNRYMLPRSDTSYFAGNDP